MARKSKVVRKLVLGIKAKLTAHQVNIVTGEATIVDKNTIQCGGETYECENCCCVPAVKHLFLLFREWKTWITGRTVMHWIIKKYLLH